jgi:hypothetical protein
MRVELAGHDAQQRRLPRPVGPHQRDLGPVPYPEPDVVEQDPPVGQLESDAGQLDVSHERPVCGIRLPRRDRIA